MLTQTSTINLLSSLATVRVDVAQIVDFVLRIVYNRPKREKAPGKSRYAMLFVKKGEKKVFVQTKQLSPDERSLCMKIYMMKMLIRNIVRKCVYGCLYKIILVIVFFLFFFFSFFFESFFFFWIFRSNETHSEKQTWNIYDKRFSGVTVFE